MSRFSSLSFLSATVVFFLAATPCFAAFEYRWQIEVLSEPDLTPGLATFYKDAIFFTRWLGREDCPGQKLYRVPFGGEVYPEAVDKFDCVFKIWPRSDGLLVAATTTSRAQVNLFFSADGEEWKAVKEDDYAPGINLVPSRNALDVWLSDSESTEWDRIDKRGSEFGYKSKAARIPLVTNTKERERKFRFPVRRGKTLIVDEAVLNPEKPSHVWVFDLGNNGAAEALNITSTTPLSGLSLSDGGLVVSNATLGKVYWYGVPTAALVKTWKLKRHQIRHTPVIPWRESENSAEFWKVLGEGVRK